MILDGKYIKINVENAKTILHFLYNKGYAWYRVDEIKNINELLQMISKYFGDEKIVSIYVESINARIFFRAFDVEKKKEITITQLLREDKLKRILK